jgi:drug/metabolite transporter (DMT)-like permease
LAALKYLDTSLAFISIRITASFLVLYIWIYILGDNLSFYNIIWFFIWIIAIFLLSWFSFSQKHKIHKKGIIAAIVAMIGITWAHSYFKYIVNDVDIPSYMFFKFLVSFLFLILYMIARKKFQNFNLESVKKILLFSLISCTIFIIYFLYLIPNIYILWPLSLWYKVLSYSIVVPIVLSIILYKEKITPKKIFAFVLTIISIGLFLI